MMKSSSSSLRYFQALICIVFTSLFFIEAAFRLFSKEPILSFAFVRIAVFCLVTAFLTAYLLALFPYRRSRKILRLMLLACGIYASFQLAYMDYMHRFFSIRDLSYGVERVIDYAMDFIASWNPLYATLLIPWLVVLLAVRHIDLEPLKWSVRSCVTFTVSLILLHGASIGLLFVFNSATQLNSPYEIYQKIRHSTEAVNQIGVFRFLDRDIIMFFNPEDEETIIMPEQPILPEEPVKPTDYSRKIDDQRWATLISEETDANMLTIDRFLISRTIEDKNAMTGIFKDKNLIYLMVEALDLMAIDEQLTPTLYRMMETGWYFDNFYSPQYSCATGQSEFIGLVSLVPETNNCTVNDYAENDYAESIFNLFNDQGYYSSSYHSWTDQYYDRKILHESMYSDHFYNYRELPFKTIQGWQSDKDLFELAFPHYIDRTPFFSFIITSSMHFPYDVKSTLGDRYLDEINAVHPDYPIEVKRYLSKSMEFDKGLEYLLDTLNSRGILDDTVIIMFADHHPLNMGMDNIERYSYGNYDRSTSYGATLSPFIIYNSAVDDAVYSEPMSTMDMLPTIANLFDLNFDPRLYMGNDYFGASEKIVYYPSGSWLGKYGYYNANKSQFYPFSGYEDLDPAFLNSVNTSIKNLFSISKLIYKTDYFRYRHDVVFPTQPQ